MSETYFLVVSIAITAIAVGALALVCSLDLLLAKQRSRGSREREESS